LDPRSSALNAMGRCRGGQGAGMVWADNLERTSDRTWHRQAGAALGLDVGADAARSECKKGLEWEEGKKGQR